MRQSQRLKWRRKITTIDWWVVVMLVGLMVRPVLDPDLGWHLRLGQEMVKTGAVVRADNLSFSLPGYEFVDHSWMMDAVTFEANLLWGLWGVNLIYGGLTALALWLVYLTSKKMLKSVELGLLVAVIGVYVMEFVGLRTHAATLLGIAWIWYVFVSDDDKERLSWREWLTNGKRWSLPVVFWVWANMHAGFVLGLVLWGSWWAVGVLMRLAKTKTCKFKNTEVYELGWIAGSAVVTMINPYGVGVWKFAFDLARNQTAAVTNADWLPLLSSRLPSDTLLMRWGLVTLWGASLMADKRWLKQKLIVTGLMVMTLWSIRYSLMLLMVMTPLLIVAVEEQLSEWVEKLKVIAGKKWRGGLMVGTLVLVGAVMLPTWQQTMCAYRSDECYAKQGQYPIKAVEYMRENKLVGKVFNYYTWGGYLEWQLPQNKYFIDGRMDSFYVNGKSFLTEFSDIVEMKAGWQEKLKSYQPDYILLPKEMVVVSKLKDQGWQEVETGEVEVLLACGEKMGCGEGS